jgi:hypothetical protein
MNFGIQIVEDPHPEAFAHQAIDQMSANESRTTGYEDMHDLRNAP